MEVRQGELYWYEYPDLGGAEQAGRRPAVVIQNDVVNRTTIRTTIICALTTNLNRARARGNVLLSKGEGNLSRPSVVNVTQIQTVDKSKLRSRIGALNASRVSEILVGLEQITRPPDTGPE